jgi:hypothetical protein
MAAVGARWLRFDIDWRTIQAGGRNHFDWAPFDAVVRGARLRGINVLGIIVSTPPGRARRARATSARRRSADYARFAVPSRAATRALRRPPLADLERAERRALLAASRASPDTRACTRRLCGNQASGSARVVVSGGTAPS